MWIARGRGYDPRTELSLRMGREVQCLRAACARARGLRRWWLRRRLMALESAKVALDQQAWRRRR